MILVLSFDRRLRNKRAGSKLIVSVVGGAINFSQALEVCGAACDARNRNLGMKK